MANTHSVDFESGSSQFASRADNASMSITGDMTDELWLKFESLPADGALMVWTAKWLSAGDERAYQFGLFNDAGTYKIQAQISGDTAGSDTVRYTWAVSTGVWYHVAITVDVSAAVASQFEFFINAASQGNGDVIADGGFTAIADSTAAFVVGASQDGTANFFDGLINSKRVWADIRSGAEISANYQTSTPAGDNLRFSGFYNNDSDDDSGNGNDLTTSGSPVYVTDIPYVESQGGLPSSKLLTGVGK